ncbi:S1/P1 nuclease [Bradyrhizobium sp. UFLA05-109]
MRRAISISFLAVTLGLASCPARAWWDEGHMQIAYLAYKRLSDPVRDKADALLKLNADYAKWTAGAPDEKTAKMYAFVHAATWADDIKTKQYGYTRDAVTSPAAGQNIGYSDHNQHAFWHFKDIDFTPDGTPLPPGDPVDFVTQLKLLTAALPASSGASDDVRSYDLVWILHLVGDAHQPLHAAARYTVQIPDGDAGGNAESVVPASGWSMALHAYWDAIFGGYSSPYGAIFDADDKDGLSSVGVSQAEAQIADPAVWAQESADLAKQFAYAPPVSAGKNPVFLTREYETSAKNVARARAALAAARLANLIDNALK